MIVLAVADTHGVRAYDEALRERILMVERLDVLIHSGDFSDIGANEEPMLGNFLLALERGAMVGFVLGNHELMMRGLSRSLVHEMVPGAIDLDQGVLSHGGVTFVGARFLRGKVSFVFGRQPRGPLVFVAHEPPWGWTYQGKTCGDVNHLHDIETLRPDFVFCGHLHERCGKPREQLFGATRVINAGPYGLEIEIESQRRTT